jgi:imidazolonepropionase-like amidohydrolase
VKPFPLILICVLVSILAVSAQTPTAARPTFHLFFIGHDIGGETDTIVPIATGTQLQAAFHFLDRSTSVDLTGTLDLTKDGSPTHLVVKGRNYRLFSSDSDITIDKGRVHVRDLSKESDIAIGGKLFFPVDNYAPIGVQERLIQYWLSHGRPAEIVSSPAGPIRIRKRDGPAGIERLSIDGVVWGTETAWVESGRLVALTTWAGALPFEAARDGYESKINDYIQQAAADRMADLNALTERVKPIESSNFALVGATIIDGTDRKPIERGTIIVRDGRIAAVGPSSTTLVTGLPTVDATGKTIVPGLWDMHAHAAQIDWAPVYLASGVTTIRDMGGEMAFLSAVRDAIASGAGIGPRYLLAGLVDGPGPQSFGAVTAATAEDGISVVQRYHDARFEQMKIYDYVTPEVVKVITSEAHKLGMTVTGHVPRNMTAQSVVDAGFDQIAHMQLRGQPGSNDSAAQIAFFKTHNTVMDPTQSWSELSSRPSELPLNSLLPGIERLPRPLTRMFDSMTLRSGDAQAIRSRQLESLKLLKNAVDAGVWVVAGTDKGVPGFSLAREIELYVDGGMTSLQAIQAATIMPAKAMKLDREVGTIEAGKRADLVILAANPLDNIRNIRSARQVVANGRLYDCNALWIAAGYAPAN